MPQLNGAWPSQPDRWWRPGRLAGVAIGLMLVEQLAADWGVDTIAGDGKRVWFELDRPSVAAGGAL